MKNFLISFGLLTAGLLFAGVVEVATRSSPADPGMLPKSCCTAAIQEEEATETLANASCSCGGKGCNCVNQLCGGTQSCQCGGTECNCPDRCNFAGTYSCCSGTHYDGSNTLHCNRYCTRSTCDACNCPVTCRCK